MNVTVKKKTRKQVNVSSPPASGDSNRPTAISDARWERIARKAFDSGKSEEGKTAKRFGTGSMRKP